MKRAKHRFPWQPVRVEESLPEARAEIARRPRRGRPAGTVGSSPFSETFSVLDVGTTHLKALVCRAGRHGVEVVGRSLVPYVEESGSAPMPVQRVCERALSQAEDMTAAVAGRKIVPDTVIFPLPAGTVHAGAFRIAFPRRDASSPIDEKELFRALQAAQRIALEHLIQGNTFISDPVLFFPATEMRVGVDGHWMDDPLGVRGSSMYVRTFNALASAALLRAMGRLTGALRLTEAFWYIPALAVVRAHLPALSQDGVGIDIGGQRSAIALWRDGLPEGVTAVSMGGMAFTKALARAGRMTLDQAERVKEKCTREALDADQLEATRAFFRPVWEKWAEQVCEAMVSLSGETPLPAHIWLWGGGSRLVGADEAVRRVIDGQGLAFDGSPQIRLLGETRLPYLQDLAGGAQAQDLTARALAVSHYLSQTEPQDPRIVRATRHAVSAVKLELWTTYPL